MSEADDLVLTVGRDGIAGAIELQGAVGIHLLQSNGEQLQNFTGKVFVGIHAVARLVVIHHVQIVPHDGAQSDVRQQRGEVAEGVVLHHVLPEHESAGIVDLLRRDDEDLRKSPGHALPQLILTGERVGEEALLHNRHVIVSRRRGKGGSRRANCSFRNACIPTAWTCESDCGLTPKVDCSSRRAAAAAFTALEEDPTCSANEFEVAEPGSGLITVTCTVPACALVAVPVAVSSVEETNVVGRNVPPKDTTAPGANF